MQEFDNLKKEFENFEKECFITREKEENFDEGEGFMEILKKYMLAPQMCGVYFSRLDIKSAAEFYGESIQLRERKRMLTDLLKAVFSKEDMQRLFDIFTSQIDHKTDIYKELADNFSSDEIFDEMIQKAEKFKTKLKNITDEFEGVV